MSGELETNASPMQLARNSQVSILDLKFDGALLCEDMVWYIEIFARISPRLRAALTAVNPGFFVSERALLAATRDPDDWKDAVEKIYDPLTTALDLSPLLLALCMEQLNLQPGQTFGHLGLGSGYALAVAAALVGPTGRCYGDASQATLDREPMARLQMARKSSSNSQWAPAEFLDVAQFSHKKSHFHALLYTRVVLNRRDVQELQRLLAPGGLLVVAMEAGRRKKPRLRLIREDDEPDNFGLRNFLASSPEFPKLKAEVEGWSNRRVQTPRSGPPTLQQMAGKAVERFFMQGTAGRNWRAAMADLRVALDSEDRDSCERRLETEDRRGLQSHREPSPSCGPLSDLQQTLRGAQSRGNRLGPLRSGVAELFRDVYPQTHLFSSAISAAQDLMTEHARAWIALLRYDPSATPFRPPGASPWTALRARGRSRGRVRRRR